MQSRRPRPFSARAATCVLLASTLIVGCLGDVSLDDGLTPSVGGPVTHDAGQALGTDGGIAPPAPFDGGTGLPNLGPDVTPLLPDGGHGAPGPAPDAQGPAPDAPGPEAGAPGPDASPLASDDVTDIAACADARTWPDNATQWEREVLELTNQARAAGHNCDAEGDFGPAPALSMEPHLRCSSRLHSAYMARTGDFNHTQTATGLDPFERIAATGYRSRAAGENIAAGQSSPRAVVDGWLDSDGHCRNVMDPTYTQLGVGYVLGSIGYKHYWTQNFGKPM